MSNTDPQNTRTSDHPLNRHLFIADNIDLLRNLDNDSIDLVVTDPPFGKGRTFTSDGLKPALTAKEIKQEREQMAAWGIHTPADARNAGVEWPSNGEAAYDDIWSWQDVHEKYVDQIESAYPTLSGLITTVRSVHSDSHAAYLTYMAVRLTEISRVLKPTGSIYLHCDHTASHYLKLLMDCVFGRENFRNEIVWGYNKPRPAKWQFVNNHDIILFYSGEGVTHTFNPQRVPTMDGKFEERKPFTRPDGTVWEPKGPGKLAGSWWYDIPSFATRMNAKERVGYPTQKPVALAERIIKASSNPGDVVLDPFAGCAYVPVAAEALDRQWIACDISVRAMTVVRRQFNKFLYSVDGSPVTVKKRGKKMTEVFLPGLEDAAVVIRGAKQLPDRSDEDPDPPPVLVLEEPVYKGQLFTRKEMLEKLLELSGWQAWCCGFAVRRADGSIVETTKNFHLDHIEPQNAGGGDYIVNRAPLCPGCNGKKGKRSITLNHLREEVAADGDLISDSVDDLPNVSLMQQQAVNLLIERKKERGVL